MHQLYQLLQIEQLKEWTSLLDIAILWFAVYKLLVLIRRTRGVQMVYGLIAVGLLYWVTDPTGPFPLKAVHFVIGALVPYGVIAAIVIFQSPIRQALAWFGRVPWSRVRQIDQSRKIIEEVALAASAMGSRRIGALIVLERSQGLRNFIETGITLDAVVSYDILINIFTPKTPLHDGAVIISDGRIKGASCFLPLSVDPYISRTFGTRHRAAIGITEESDSIAVVVSEERGVVSVAIDGALRQDLDTRGLRAILEEHWAGPRSTAGPQAAGGGRKAPASAADKRADRTAEIAS
jgi:diadenylate cyclase